LGTVPGWWTNLVIGDSLPQIFEKPEHIFIVLNVVSETLQLRPLVQRAQFPLDVLELAGRKLVSSPKSEGKNDILYQLTSAPLFIHIAWKC